MVQSNKQSPWYAVPKKEEPKILKNLESLYKKWQTTPFLSADNLVLLTFFVAIVGVALGGFTVAFCLWPNAYPITKILAVVIGLIVVVIGMLGVLRAVGVSANKFLRKETHGAVSIFGFLFLRNEFLPPEPRSSVPAPELALQSFVQQVRAYAQEVNYVRGRELRTDERKPGSPDPTDLMKRRWSEVVDSLNEFEIYLANAPSAVIETFVSKSPTQHLDVSQVFRDVADAFDTTWRRKGINIESAIVSPLKATANEALLRRLLVGPWRSSAYFARRGTGVVFSAKSVNNRVVATWECNGLCIPESYLVTACDSSISLNERIERGMAVLSTDVSVSPNTFLGLLSFLTWVDLAKACEADFELKNASEGFQIVLRLH